MLVAENGAESMRPCSCENKVRSFVRKPSKSELCVENLKREEGKLPFQRIGVAIHEKLSTIKHVT